MRILNGNWTELKDFATDRGLIIQYLDKDSNYYLYAFDGPMAMECVLPKSSPASEDQEDFETNYKPISNRPLRDNSTIKMVRAKTTTNGSGVGTLLIKIPGTIGLMGARFIRGGVGWFKTPHADDYFKVYLSDEDNILGTGSGTIVGSYTDTDMDSSNQGWYLPVSDPIIRLERMGEVSGPLMGGLYLKIILQKGDNSVDDFYANIIWGVY